MTARPLPYSWGTAAFESLFGFESPPGLGDGGLAYGITGARNGRPIVVLGGITATRTPASIDQERPGWWKEIVRRDGPVDPVERRVVSVNFLGVRDASERASTSHITISTEDQARALAALLDFLGLERPMEMVGASYGGMVLMHLAALRPDLVRRLMVISAAHRTHPMATALRSLQRRVLEMGVRVGEAERCVAIARGIGMTTYRTAAEFESRFESRPSWRADGPRFEVEDYLDHKGQKAAELLSAESLRCLSESSDTHLVRPEDITVPTVAVAVEGDTLVPPWLIQEFTRRHGGRCRLVELDSRFGHDAFLKETSAVGAIVREFLQEDAS